MPNSSRNDGEESVFCLFLRKNPGFFSLLSSTFIRPVEFTPIDFDVSDVLCVLMTLASLRHKNDH